MTPVSKRKIPSIKRFELHPAAKPAIDFFHSIPTQFPFPPVAIRRLVTAHSIIQGAVSDDRFLMFDPVWTLRFWDGNRPPEGCQLISYRTDEISEEKISMITWSNTLNIVFSSISKNNGLSKLQESLNRYLPANIKQQLGLKRTNISEREVAQWANVSAGTIPAQRKTQTEGYKNYQGDIFGELSKHAHTKK